MELWENGEIIRRENKCGRARGGDSVTSKVVTSKRHQVSEPSKIQKKDLKTTSFRIITKS